MRIPKLQIEYDNFIDNAMITTRQKLYDRGFFDVSDN